VISLGGDKPFVSMVTSIAPMIIKSGNSQISFFMVLIEGSVPKKAAGWQARSPLFEIALVFVRFYQIASRIVNANHGVV
jgi:hypothetical protein